MRAIALTLLVMLVFLPLANAETVEVTRKIVEINGTAIEVRISYHTEGRIVGLIITENLPEQWKVISSDPPHLLKEGRVKWLIRDVNGVGSGEIIYRVLTKGNGKITGEWRAIDYNGQKFEGEIMDLTMPSSKKTPGFTLLTALTGLIFYLSRRYIS